MYCKKCGCRINYGEQICSNCGTEVTSIEYCGGFWNLVGEIDQIEKIKEDESNNNKNQSIRKNEYKRNEEKRIEICESSDKKLKNYQNSAQRKEKDKRIGRVYKNRIKILSYVLVVFILLTVIQTVRFASFSKRYKKSQNEYQILNEEYQELDLQYKNLDSKYNNLNSEYNNLKKEYDQLNEINSKMIERERKKTNEIVTQNTEK